MQIPSLVLWLERCRSVGAGVGVVVGRRPVCEGRDFGASGGAAGDRGGELSWREGPPGLLGWRAREQVVLTFGVTRSQGARAKVPAPDGGRRPLGHLGGAR